MPYDIGMAPFKFMLDSGVSHLLDCFPAKGILAPEGVAGRLKVRKGWVYQKTRSHCPNPIPCLRVGRYIRFDWAKVVEWLSQDGANSKPGNEVWAEISNDNATKTGRIGGFSLPGKPFLQKRLEARKINASIELGVSSEPTNASPILRRG